MDSRRDAPGARGRALLAGWTVEHQSAMLAVARKYADPSTTAEDIVQDAFLALLRTGIELDDVASPRALLLAYTRKTGRNKMRSRRRRANILSENQEEVIRALWGDERPPDRRLETVLEALPNLPRGPRRTLWLMLVEDMADDGIAAELQVAVPTVRSHRSRAIQALKRMFREGGG